MFSRLQRCAFVLLFLAFSMLLMACASPQQSQSSNTSPNTNTPSRQKASGPPLYEGYFDIGSCDLIHGWAWNQALLDLGALVCRPRPRCQECPLALGGCAWHAGGRQAPDPWRPGARQSRFAGSDRQGRGRLVDALRRGPVGLDAVAAAAGWPDDPERAWRIAETLVAEGFVTRDGLELSL